MAKTAFRTDDPVGARASRDPPPVRNVPKNKTVETPTSTSMSTSPERESRAATIAKRLGQLRREHNMSQDAVGALAGASQATVSRWEDPESLSTPSALELVELAAHFHVDVAWMLGTKDHREELPYGQAIIDQSLLNAFAESQTAEELKQLLAREMTFGTIWVQIPPHAEILAMPEALRRVKEVDRHVRKVHPDLWHEWARLVLS